MLEKSYETREDTQSETGGYLWSPLFLSEGPHTAFQSSLTTAHLELVR